MNALLSERSIKMWLFIHGRCGKKNGKQTAPQRPCTAGTHFESRPSWFAHIVISSIFGNGGAPQAAIYSAGRRNVYGHPHQEVLDRLKILGIPAFGTRRHGTITVITDGTDFEIISSVGSDRELAKSLQ